MTETMSRVENTQDPKPVTGPAGLDGLDEQLISQLVDGPRPAGCS